MHVLAAPDKFRGTASAPDIAAAIVAAVERSGHTCEAIPMADGGEGLLEVFGGANRHTWVSGPDGRPVRAGWRLDGSRAVIESARACGLELSGGADRNDPVAATTAGVGQLIVAALEHRARRILVGLGGSATTDGGAGALRAVEAAGATARVESVDLEVCCDVRTRFTNAADVFGTQKGADTSQVVALRARLESLREIYQHRYGRDPQKLVGSGAAGGLAGGLAMIGGILVPGVALVAREVGLEAAIARCDLVITGEGRFDTSSLAGKVVAGVSDYARRLERRVLVVAGVREAGLELPGVDVRTLVEEVGERRALADTLCATTDVVQSFLTRG